MQIRVEDKFAGPTLSEMEFLFHLGEGPFEARWEATHSDIHLAHKYKHKDITLVVPTLSVMERVASQLGLPISMDRNQLVSIPYKLNSLDNNWRAFSGATGHTVTRSALLHITASGLRKGKNATHMRRELAADLLSNVSPADLDVLYMLRIKGARV